MKITNVVKDFIDSTRGENIDSSISHKQNTYVIDKLSASAVVSPSNIEELKISLAFANERDLKVAPWGGGTLVDIGNQPERFDVAIDMSKLNQVIEHNPKDLTAIVQAGITLQNLQSALNKRNQFVALNPPVPSLSTVGGTLATNIAGPLKWQNGSPRDTVIGMKIVQSDGTITKSGGRVVKNVSGYDMSRLHIGAIGTLGVIAEVSFKLTPKPAKEATVTANFTKTKHCIDAGLAVFHSNMLPLSITTKMNHENKIPSAKNNTPNFRLFVRVGGRTKTLERQIREINSICKMNNANGLNVLHSNEMDALWSCITDFGWDNTNLFFTRLRVFIEPTATDNLINAVMESDSSINTKPSIVCHPAHGTVIITLNHNHSKNSIDQISNGIAQTSDIVKRLNGKMIVEKAPPEIKSKIDVWGDTPESISVMHSLKTQYDPKRTLNPGRYLGGI